MPVSLHLKLSISEMKRIVLYIALIFFFSILLTHRSVAQRISFGLYASESITITALGLGELNFNDKQPVILGGNSVQILLTDEAAAILTITGRADLDITVTISAPPNLVLDVDNQIPLSLLFAYSNMGASDEATAKTQAIQVPAGFTSATFPVLRRSSGPPGPPPTPDHPGVTYPTGTAYLFIYGSMGPVPNNAAVGLYEGDINITVSYSTYN
jgi:hypothetical protein